MGNVCLKAANATDGPTVSREAMKQRLIWLIIMNTTIDPSLFEYLKLHCFAYLRHSIDERMHIRIVKLDLLYRNVVKLEIFSVKTKLGFPFPQFPTTIPLSSVTSDVGTRSVYTFIIISDYFHVTCSTTLIPSKYRTVLVLMNRIVLVLMYTLYTII